MTRKSVLIILTILILTGCVTQKHGGAGSTSWEKMPAVAFGVLKSEMLSIQPWNSGRAEETSQYALAESEKGFFFLWNNYLYYSDKTQPELWVPICNDPDCDHQDAVAGCSAILYTDRILVKDGQIIFSDEISANQHLYKGNGGGRALMSMSSNGDDLKLLYYIEDSLLHDAGMVNEILHSTYWLYQVTSRNQSGDTSSTLYCVDSEGAHVLMDNIACDTLTPFMDAESLLGLFGDEAYYFNYPECNGFYEVSGGTLVPVALPERTFIGGYFSGNTIRYYEPNAGYYDYSLTSGETVQISENRLENSYAAVILPNLIVESTLLYELSTEGRTLGMKHAMEIFDGEQWHSVQLPEEMQLVSRDFWLMTQGVTSDAIWFSSEEKVIEVVNKEQYEYRDTHLYRIDLTSGEWKLKRFATVRQPRVQS